MKTRLFIAGISLFFATTAHAYSIANCSATYSKYQKGENGVGRWLNQSQNFFVQSQAGQVHVNSVITIGEYEFGAIIDEKEAFNPPTKTPRLTLQIVRRDGAGIFKFHANSSTALPITPETNVKLNGWDFSGEYEKFDIGLSIVCR
jgi:hypothetical protein